MGTDEDNGQKGTLESRGERGENFSFFVLPRELGIANQKDFFGKVFSLCALRASARGLRE